MSINAGIIPITQQSFASGTGSARDSAIQQQLDMNQKQNDLNKLASGGRRRHRGGADQIPVPQFQMQYKPTGGPGTNPNDQVTQSMATFTQANKNATFDSQSAVMGGRRRFRKCNKSKRLCKSRKSRKQRKKTRRNRRH